MEKSPEETYTDLVRQLASPGGVEPEALARMFGEVERMHAIGAIEDWQMQNAREAYARTTGSTLGDAAQRAKDKAQAALRFAAEQVRDRTTAAVVTYTEKDPVRAVLIAAGVGAVLMGLVGMMARSGARRVRRRLR